MERGAVFRKIFDQKLEVGEILFQNEGSQNVHDQPFLNHLDKGKVQVTMVSTMDEEMISQLEVESDLDQRAQKVQ